MSRTDLPGHESYALLAISRVQGSMDLFGSPIVPMNFVTLTVSKASQCFDLGTEWNHDGETVLEIAMTETQFAQAITTLNTSPGTPCTLMYSLDGERLKKYERPPRQESAASRTRDEFRAEVEARMGAMDEAQARVDKLMKEGSLSAKRREEITGEINRLLRLFRSSAPFFMERFEENAEQVVAQAKAEITAHAELVLRNTGVQALGGDAIPMLSEGK